MAPVRKRRAPELTDEGIAALPFTKPGERRHVLDPDTRGLVVRIAHTSKTFTLQLRDRTGHPIRRALGKTDEMTIAEAREKAAAWRAEVRRGADPKIEEEKRIRAELAKVANSFEAATKLFVLRYLLPKNRSWKESARQLGWSPAAGDPRALQIIKGGLVAKWGARNIAEISRADVVALLDDIADRAPIMANRVLAVLRKFYKWALSRDMVQTSPCEGIAPPSAERSRDRVLSDVELRAVWHAARGIGYPFGPIVQLLILTGQRRTEVGEMVWSEVDVDSATWKLPRERTKNDTEHVVPLCGPALGILTALPRVKGVDLVFSTTGSTAVSGFSNSKNALDRESGVTDWRLHDLRRTVASGMARLGVNLPVIEKVLNHVSGSFAGIVGVYQRHSFDAEKRAALDAWASCVMSLVGDEPTKVVQLRRA